MKAKLIKIGNSRGVRLPHNLIEKHHLGQQLEIIDTDKGLLIKSGSVRANWEDKFDKALGEYRVSSESDWTSFPNRFDDEEWTW